MIMFIDFFIIHDKKKRNYHNEGNESQVSSI